MTRPRRDIPILVLGAALCASAALLIALGWKLTFYQDTWVVLLGRRSWTLDAILMPHNEHLVAFQVIFEKLFYELFGIQNNHPEMLLSVALVLGVATLLFVWMRRRMDEWLALILTVMLLFFGAAWQELLWPFQIGFSAPLLFGLAALLALERDDTRGDVAATAFLVLCVGSGSLGLPLLVACFVAILLNCRRGWRRLVVVAVPALLYAGWYLHWGREAAHHLTFDDVLASPVYVFEGFANAVGALAGLGGAGVNGGFEPVWGRPLLLALLGFAAYRLCRRGRVPTGLWPVLAAALSYWLLAAFNAGPGREATNNRYVYAGAVFVLMIAAELLRGARIGKRGLALAAVLAAVTILPNLGLLKEGNAFFRQESEITRADTGAILIARETISPFFQLIEEVAGTPSLESVYAIALFEAVDDYGPTGYSGAELETAPQVARRQADIVLAAALPIRPEPSGAYAPAAPAGKACATLAAGEAAEREVPVKPGRSTVELAPGGPGTITMRRYAAGEFPVAMGIAEGGTSTTLKIPRDRASAPWYVHVEAAQAVRVCTS